MSRGAGGRCGLLILTFGTKSMQSRGRCNVFTRDGVCDEIIVRKAAGTSDTICLFQRVAATKRDAFLKPSELHKSLLTAFGDVRGHLQILKASEL